MVTSSARRVRIGFIFIMLVLLTACAGPSTRVLPRESQEREEFTQGDAVVLEESNPYYLQEEVDILASAPRAAGTEGERRAVRYISQLLGDYGYEVSRQDFLFQGRDGESPLTGENVVAVRRADSAEADILILASHYDTVPASPGAGSAAGVAAMLETARLLSRMPSDTELRFVCFSGDGDGRAGALSYVSSLPEEERQRIVGAVELGALGTMAGGEEIAVETEDGLPTALGESIETVSAKTLGSSWPYRRSREGIHCFFLRGQIPAMTVAQAEEAYEDGSRFDRPELVDIGEVALVTDVMSRAFSELMDPSTHSIRAKSRYYNPLRDICYVQEPGEPVPFGQNRSRVEARMGMAGETETGESGEEGPVQICYYPVRWFGNERVRKTGFTYSDGKLVSVSLDSEAAGRTFEEICQELLACYGRPVGEKSGPYGISYQWDDLLTRTHLALDPGAGGYTLVMTEYPAEPVVTAEYDVAEAEDSGDSPVTLIRRQAGAGEDAGPREILLRDLAGQFVPRPGLVAGIRFFTDGQGGQDFRLAADQPDGSETAEAADTSQTQEEVPSLTWEIDLEDVIGQDGRWKNRTDTVRKLLLLCGQSLAQDSQYRTAFEETFGGAASGTALDDPSEAPAGADLVHPALPGIAPGEEELAPPDLAESFVWFVLAGQPAKEEGQWGARLGFFYQYKELAAYRMRIRDLLNIMENNRSGPDGITEGTGSPE